MSGYLAPLHLVFVSRRLPLLVTSVRIFALLAAMGDEGVLESVWLKDFQPCRRSPNSVLSADIILDNQGALHGIGFISPITY
jgi:hypothetical protein